MLDQRFGLVIATVVLAAKPVSAVLIPCFDLTACAWKATHIAVTDSSGKVHEVWAGDLKVGEQLPWDKFGIKLEHPVGGFERHSGFPLRPHGLPLNKADRLPAKVTGKRLIVFLRKDGGEWKPAGRPFNAHGPLRPGEFDISTAWAEAGYVFALIQEENPGPLVMVRVADSEEQFKKKVFEIAEQGSRYRAAIVEPDPARRATRLEPFVVAKTFKTVEAIRRLADCGPAGVKALSKVVAEPKLRWCHPRAIRAMGVIGRPAAEKLYGILREELAYWEAAVAKGVDANWVNNREHTYHKDRLVAALFWGTAYAYVSEDDERMRLIYKLDRIWRDHPILGQGWKENSGQNGRGGDGFGHPGYLTNQLSWKWSFDN